MDKLSFRVVLVAVMALMPVVNLRAADEFDPDSIADACRRVVSNHLKRTLDNGWQMGTYMTGVMALYYLTEDRRYLDSAIAWGEVHDWKPNTGDVLTENYDNVCCLQTYYEIYLQQPSQLNLSRLEAAITNTRYYTYDEPIATAWPIIDMAFMSAPNMVRCAAIMKDTAMLDSVYVFSVRNASRHYNPLDSLWRSHVGNDIGDTDITYWGRGCGWAVGYLCRVLQFLPQDHYARPWFNQRLAETLTSLIKYQQADGLWRSDLTHPDVIPSKETSSTAFFTFGMLYGLNNGIVDRATFWPVVQKAWAGLIGCQRPDGRIGYSQGVGGGPAVFNPDNANDYTDGAFLLAGYELYKYLTGKDRSQGFVFDPMVLSFGVAKDRIDAAVPQVIRISNRSPDLGQLQGVKARAEVDWLDVSFSDNEGNEQTAVVALNTRAGALALGDYSGTIMFTGTGVDTLRVTVKLSISQYGPNLALNKPTTQSSFVGGGFGAKAVDGSPTSRWESEKADNQWLAVDLGGRCGLERVSIKWEAAAAKVYALQLSEDGQSWTTIDSITDGKSGELRVLTVQAEGRHLRVFGYSRTTGYGYSIYELEVYGRSLEPIATRPPRTAGRNAVRQEVLFSHDRVQLSLTRAGAVTVEAIWPDGRTAATLFSGQLSPGSHVLPLRRLQSAQGVYFLRVNCAGKTFVHPTLQLRR